MSHELYRLLGLGEDVDIDRLRRVYEEQMSSAARSHDHSRALQLSNALDSASPAVRSAMYPRMTTRVGPVAQPAAAGSRTRLTTRTRTAARPRPPGHSRAAVRPILIMVAVAAVVVAVAWFNRESFRSTGGNSIPQSPQHIGRSSIQPTVSGFVASAGRDAHKVVDGIQFCRRTAHGALPASVPRSSGQLHLSCGGATVDLDLEPGNTVEYLQTGRRSYRVIVTAQDGEFVTYNSRTHSFSG
ncbi:MAG: hypothetical protein QOI15_175 [Pseudonocardiales bacterium]|nr:hypothetical protein [Pseudonocardiales bacterium]